MIKWRWWNKNDNDNFELWDKPNLYSTNKSHETLRILDFLQIVNKHICNLSMTWMNVYLMY